MILPDLMNSTEYNSEIKRIASDDASGAASDATSGGMRNHRYAELFTSYPTWQNNERHAQVPARAPETRYPSRDDGLTVEVLRSHRADSGS